MNSLAKNSILNLVYTILNLLFPLISSIYVTRVIDVDSLGQVVFSQSITSYFVTLAMLGIPNYGVREIAKIKENKKCSKLFSELFIINVITTFVSLIIYVFTIFSVSSFKSNLGLFIACGSSIFFNAFNIDWFYQGLEKYGYIVLRSIIIKTLSLIALFIFVKENSDYIIYAWITSFAVGGNNLLNVIHSRKYVHLNIDGINLKKHLKSIFILSVGTALSVIYARIDTTMLGLLAGNYQTGYYSYAHKTIDIAISACTAITAVFMPRLSNYYNRSRKEFYDVLYKGTDIITFIVFPAATGLFILSQKLIILLYGDNFLPSASLVRLFTALIVVKGYGNLLCFQLVISTGQEKQRLPANIIAGILNIILNSVLIPITLAAGAVVASIVSEVVVNMYQIFKIKDIVEIRVNRSILIKSILSSFIMGLAVYFISKINLSNFYSCIISVISGIIVYIICSLLLKNEVLIIIIKNIKLRIRAGENKNDN